MYDWEAEDWDINGPLSQTLDQSTTVSALFLKRVVAP
jgi:hypothetical protein